MTETSNYTRLCACVRVNELIVYGCMTVLMIELHNRKLPNIEAHGLVNTMTPSGYTLVCVEVKAWILISISSG